MENGPVLLRGRDRWSLQWSSSIRDLVHERRGRVECLAMDIHIRGNLFAVTKLLSTANQT